MKLIFEHDWQIGWFKSLFSTFLVLTLVLWLEFELFCSLLHKWDFCFFLKFFFFSLKTNVTAYGTKTSFFWFNADRRSENAVGPGVVAWLPPSCCICHRKSSGLDTGVLSNGRTSQRKWMYGKVRSPWTCWQSSTDSPQSWMLLRRWTWAAPFLLLHHLNLFWRWYPVVFF